MVHLTIYRGTSEAPEALPASLSYEHRWLFLQTDLKSFRLVSREFYDCAGYVTLVTELWFGLYAEDLESFKGLCRTPTLAKHVTSIVLDATPFGGRGENDRRRILANQGCARTTLNSGKFQRGWKSLRKVMGWT
ncbi:hypothetical protein VTL71DRAFT_15761 [Oculimacula yallundae]|uniref:Uncharacterized protein n=1 Tax=Oculimacula yallundae TaxID=86028 RepID=A0ABR4CCK9_9HELO